MTAVSSSVPDPALVMSAPDAPAMIDAAVNVFPVATDSVPSDVPSVMPRAASNDIVSEIDSVPPLSEIDAAVNDAGTAPRLRSVEIETVPPVIEVGPEYEFVADSVSVPAADFDTCPLPEITPERIWSEDEAIPSVVDVPREMPAE